MTSSRPPFGVLFVAGFLALAPLLACSTTYPARGAPLGTPATPAMRAERLTTGEWALGPGEDNGTGASNDKTWNRAVVTRAGLEDRAPDRSERQTTLVWAVRVQGGAGVDILDMMWSPAGAPRCAGGHPALAILLDLDAPPNHVLAPGAQVHWERPVIVRGERVLSGRFDEDRPLLVQPSVVDVRLVQHQGGAATELCVRVPVTAPEITY